MVWNKNRRRLSKGGPVNPQPVGKTLHGPLRGYHGAQKAGFKMLCRNKHTHNVLPDWHWPGVGEHMEKLKNFLNKNEKSLEEECVSSSSIPIIVRIKLFMNFAHRENS